MNQLFSTVVYLTFFEAAFKICCLAFLFTSTDSTFPALPGLFGVTVLFFGFCFIGNELKYECATIADSIYCTKWYLCSIEEQKLLLMMLKNSYGDVAINADGFLEVTLESCLTVSRYQIFKNINYSNEFVYS